MPFRIIYLIAIFLINGCTQTGNLDSKATLAVSLANLFVVPERYEGTTISTMGVLDCADQYCLLYFSDEDRKYKNGFNAIELDFMESPSIVEIRRVELNGEHVLIYGTVYKKHDTFFVSKITHLISHKDLR